MKTLCIDTSSASCSVALAIDKDVFALFDDKPQAHSENVLSMCESVIAQAGISRTELDLLAVTRGPGSFTGVRIGVSVAQGIAYALDIPVAPLSSLAVLAQHTWLMHQSENIFCLQDARMNEIYYGAYEIVNGIAQAVIEEGIDAPADICPSENRDWVSVGTAWAEYTQELAKLHGKFSHIFTDVVVDARAMPALALDYHLKGHTVSATSLEPVYLRNKVAEKQHERG
ncbi:MAG: tRNA (adenosine(37)-N6)-threonylcarbamoyltransferase complex dimerization subunit type 1 TsaB [Gammaproteobacteria bacterium]|nr:tRNA (adenosine(37)-N6)-threonylcarbamoyltransferase complex dimerization subunit type 1 TsaB [Gammaproteobacteria bacterium]